MRRSVASEGGFTLVELVCVMLLLSVVIAGVSAVMVGGSHAELQNNNRFQAQQLARTALDRMRLDVHNACAANVGAGGTLLTLALVPSGDPTQCGAASGNPKILYCALTSPTVSTQYALYRGSATTCTTANATLLADHVTSNNLFSTAASIPVSQLQSVNVTIPVTLKQGTYGAPYTLGQALVLRNTVYQTTNSTTACPASAQNATCAWGVCPFNGPVCYPPVIQ